MNNLIKSQWFKGFHENAFVLPLAVCSVGV